MENNQIKILAIDDIQDNLITLSALIREQFDDVKILTATSGDEGLKKARAENPDLILLDILMPGLDGYETCRLIKSDSDLKDIPVVFVTALKGDKESRIKALEAGGDAFLAKPVDQSELTAQIRAMVKVKLANAEKRVAQQKLEELVKEKTIELKNNHLATLNLLEDLRNENKRRRESEAKFRSLIESSNDGISLLDLQGSIFFVNQRKVEMLGYSTLYELIGKNGYNLFPDDERSRFINMSEEFHRVGFLTNIETKLICKDEKLLPVEINFRIISDMAAGATFIMTTTRDISERKRAEAQLRQLSQAVEQSPASVVITNTDGVIEYVNPKFCELTGYTPGEATGSKPGILKSGKQLDAFYKTLWETISKGDIWTGELLNKKKNGEMYWEAATISPIFDESGAITQYLGVKEDITERKHQEEALQENERKFRTLFETSNDGIFIMDHDVFMDCNNAATKIFGCPPEKIIGSSPVKFSPAFQPDGTASSKLALEKINIAIQGGTQTFEWKHKRYDGSLFDAEVSLNTFTMKGKQYLQAIVRDITDRKREELIKQTQLNIAKSVLTSDSLENLVHYIKQQLSQLLDTSNFIVALYDAGTDMMQPVIYKEEMEGLSEWPASQTLSAQVVKLGEKFLFKKDEIPHFADQHNLSLIGTPSACWMGVPLMVENKIAGAMAIQSYSDPFAFDNSDLTLMEMIAHQVGIFIERQNLLSQLITAKEQAEQSDKLKSAFIQNISHEIRTPITGLIGFGSLMADEETTPEERMKHFQKVEKSTNRLINTISDYMDVAQLVSGTMEINISPFQVADAIVEKLETFEELIAQKNLELELDLDDEINQITVNNDQEFFQRILFELVDNAIKFTDRGKIIVSGKKEKTNLLFSVKDSGKGIPRDKQLQIFNPFTQAETSLNRGHEGSGAGLSIVKGLLELMGGKMWIESSPGVGSEFSFTIPLIHSSKDASTAKIIPPPVKPTSKPVVLIAEDDESNYLLMEVLVKKAGCDYLMAYDGLQAVEMCRQHPEITFVLMDIKMPLLTGVEALKQIRLFRPDLPIIATTAYAQLGDERRFKEKGFNEYFAKPLRPEAIIKFVKDYAAR